MIHGSSHYSHLVALVDSGSKDCSSILNKFDQIFAASDRAAHERATRVILADESFTQASGSLNGTGKLNRQFLQQRYKHVLEANLKAVELEQASAPLAKLDQTKTFAAQGGSSLQAHAIAKLYLKANVPIEPVVRALLSESIPVGLAIKQLNWCQQAVNVYKSAHSQMINSRPLMILPSLPRFSYVMQVCTKPGRR